MPDPGAIGDSGGGGLTRRQFLRYGGLATGSVVLLGAGCTIPPNAPGPPPLTRTLTLRRRLDMVKVRFDFYNLRLAGPAGRKRLVRQNANQAALIVVHFPPQTVLEQTVPEDANGNFPTPGFGIVETRLGHESRLAFTVPAGVSEIPYTSTGLLAWSEYALRVAPVALPPGEPSGRATVLREPAPTETAIELPWWLLISPNRHARFLNPSAPVTRGSEQRTELWHTRIAVATDAGIDEHRDHPLRTGRAVWAADPDMAVLLETAPDDLPNQSSALNGQPFASAMRIGDRVALVRNTSDFQTPDWEPQPFHVDNLMLTALGGWLDATGVWDPIADVSSLLSWRHRATQGRDHYVRLVNKGYYLPTGHPAALVRISERKFARRNGINAAYWVSKEFLITRRVLKEYPGFRQPDGGRAFPFRSIRLKTLVTPNIDRNTLVDLSAQINPFVPHVKDEEGAPVLYHCVGTDWAGRSIEFATPLVFVDFAMAFNGAKMAATRDAYNDTLDLDDPVRAVPLHGQKVAFAPEEEPGDSTVEVGTLVWECAEPLTLLIDPNGAKLFEQHDQPRAHPALTQAQVRLAGIEQLAGSPMATGPVVVYDPDYATDGFSDDDDGNANKADVFLNVINPAPVEFPADRSGGVVTPNLTVTAVSRRLGPVSGDPAVVKGGKFNPAQWFGDLGKILGGISLKDIVDEADVIGGQAAHPTALQITTAELPDTVETRIHWEPTLKADPLGLFDPGNPKGTFVLDGRIVQDRLDSSQSRYEVNGDLRDVLIRMLGTDLEFLVLDVRRMSFSSRTGQKPVLEVDIRETKFRGVLGFIQEFQDFLQQDGMALDITPTAIDASLSLPIPDIQLTVLSATNLKFVTGLTIPLNGEPARVRFAFSSSSDPFHITVMAIGGGGWVELAFGLDGFEWLEIGFEAGAEVGIDFGVASGSVHIFAGFIFTFESVPGAEKLSLGGYVRIGGEVDVMGVISASIELRLELTYLHKSVNGDELDILHGRASVIVEVDVLLFSGEVEIECEKSFGGDPADPTFQDQLPTSELWDLYCDAFEPVGA